MPKSVFEVVEEIGLAKNVLAGRVAVVTGAGRGIGRETALALAYLGARVLIAELHESGRETEQLIRQDGGQAWFVQTDVSSEGSVASLVKKTGELVGPVSILVNNAILSPVASVMEMDIETWDRVMAVNLRGTFLLCKAFLPGMLSSGGGTIVNMVSTDAMPFISAYIASKQGIAAFSQSLAAEVGDMGVRVIAFAPGFVDTPGLRQTGEKLAPHLGFSQQQFLNLSMHPAYDSSMPSADAGAATAYLIAALADSYHGEIIDGYTVLERAGYLNPTAPEFSGVKNGDAPNEDKSINSGAHGKSERAEALCLQLSEVLSQTEAEFTGLPVFVRPLARSGFKRKAGQSLQDWQHEINQLRGLLLSKPFDPAVTARIATTQARLAQLETYYEGVPAETARFSKDQAFLAEVNRMTRDRLALIRDLAELLKEDGKE